MKHNEIILENQAHPRLAASTTTNANNGTAQLYVDTGSGYIKLGPANTSHCHIQTDRSNFYFDKQLMVDSGVIGSYNEDLQLRRANNSSHQIQISDSSITNSLPTTVNGVVTWTGGSSTNANTAYGWGNHASAGYLTSFDITTQTDSKYLRSDANDSMAGLLSGGFGSVTTNGTTDWNHSTNARSGGGHTLLLGTHTNGPGTSNYYHPFSFEYNSKSGSGNMTQLAIPYTGTGMFFRSRYSSTWSGWTKIWNAGNDGANSGLDADLLDGQHGSFYLNAGNMNAGTLPEARLPTISKYLRSDTADIASGRITLQYGETSDLNSVGGPRGVTAFHTANVGQTSNRPDAGNYATGLEFTYYDASAKSQLAAGSGGSNNTASFYVRSEAWSATNSWTSWYKLWHSGNDGTGSGLDADLLDGQEGSYYRNAGNLNAGTIPEARIPTISKYLRSDVADTATRINSPIFSGNISTSGDGQNNYPFRLTSDYNSYMVAAAGNTWGLFWAGNSGAKYGTNGTGGPGNIWSNSSNPNEFVFAGANSTKWTLYGNTGDSWQAGTARTSPQGILWGASNDGPGSGLDADTLDGLQLHTGRNNEANKVVRTDSNGYIQAGWINTTSGSTTGTNRIYASNDGYIRYVTPATLISNLGLFTTSNDGTGSGLDADLLDGRHLSQIVPYHSGSDFANGTLITTSISASATNGASFVIEITGKSYSSSVTPHTIIAQGYLYNDSIIAYSGTNITGNGFTYIKAMNNNGYLSFWFPRHAYWNSYSVIVRDAGGNSDNKVTAIANSSDPSGATKKVTINLAKTWNSSNDGPGSGLDADTVDGQGESVFMRKSANSELDMNNYNINYVNQLHFNDNVRFYDDGNDSYLNFKYGDAGPGGFKMIDGSGNLDGYFYADGGNIGILPPDGGWGLRVSNSDCESYHNFRIPAGSATAPSLTSSADTNTGVFMPGSDVFKITTGGVNALTVNNSDIQLLRDTVSVKDYLRHYGDTDTHFRFTTDRIRMVAGNVTFMDAYESGTVDYLRFPTRYVTIGSNTNPQATFTIDQGCTETPANGCGTGNDAHMKLENTNTTGSASTCIIFNAKDSGGNMRHGAGIQFKKAIAWSANGQYPGELYFWTRPTSGNQAAAQKLDKDGNAIFKGNVTAYGSLSDRRLKENIENIPDATKKVQELNGVTFNYKKDGKKATGLIAQELQEVLPEAVYTSENIETGEEHLAIHYGNVIGLLVESIKELKAEIEDLKNDKH